MNKTYYRLMTENDIDEVLSLNLRQSDQDELRASTGLIDLREALFLCLDNSKITWVIIHDNKIEGVFGLGETPFGGIPWFLTTDKFNEFRLTFAKKSREVIQKMLYFYPFLYNCVDSRHIVMIKWLEWLGFTIDKQNKWFLADPKVPFYIFWMARST